MASPTPPVAPVGGGSETNIDAAADARLVSNIQRLMSGGEAAPAVPPPSAPPTPAVGAQEVPPSPQTTAPEQVAAPPPPAPALPGAQAPPAEQVAAPPQPAEVITIDLSRLPVEDRQAWQDAIVKANGDPGKIASLFWEYNNRLARLSAVSASPQPAAPTTEPEPPPIDVDAVVTEKVSQTIAADPDIRTWRARVHANLEKIEQAQQQLGVPAEARSTDPEVRVRSIDRAIAKAQADIDYLERRLGDADIQENLGEQDRLRGNLMKSEHTLLRLRTLVNDNETLNQRYASRLSAERSRIENEIRTEQEQFAERRRMQTDALDYQREFVGFWPGYVQAAATAAQIPPELAANFNRVAQREVLIAANKGQLDLAREKIPAQLPVFLSRVASEFLAEVDQHYRLRSAMAGRLAHQPGEPVVIPTPGGVPPATPAPTPSTPAAPGTVERAQDIDARADARRQQILQTLRG